MASCVSAQTVGAMLILQSRGSSSKSLRGYSNIYPEMADRTTFTASILNHLRVLSVAGGLLHDALVLRGGVEVQVHGEPGQIHVHRVINING